jgi:hypothetical protein
MCKKKIQRELEIEQTVEKHTRVQTGPGSIRANEAAIFGQVVQQTTTGAILVYFVAKCVSIGRTIQFVE